MNRHWMQTGFLSLALLAGPGQALAADPVSAGPPRTGSLLIAGVTVPVSQQGNDCTYVVEPASFRLSREGGTDEIRVATSDGCDWTAASQAAWIEVTDGTGGTGNGTVVFAVAANPQPTQRTGTLLVAGQAVVVVQLGSGARYLVGGIAETAGAAGTRWKSSLALANPGADAVAAPLSFAYAVVEHRVLEIPFLLKRSARYLFMQRGCTLMLSVVSIGLTVVFASWFDPHLWADEEGGQSGSRRGDRIPAGRPPSRVRAFAWASE